MPAEMPEMMNILHSGALAYGVWGRKFEQQLKEYIGAERLLTTNTYASAIQIALTVLDLKPGDEVITSPMSCLASNMPLQTFGLKVVWADIDPATGTLSPDSVASSITPRTKLIFHNHFCGYMGYVDEVNAIAKSHGIYVIDDCVEAFGSKYRGKRAGNLGTDISVFSFQTVRLPNTIDGGAIAFRDEALFEKALLARDFGIRRAMFRDDLGEISKDCDIATKGYGATMSEVNSYIGSLQMECLDRLLAVQRANAQAWAAEVGETVERKEIEPNYWVYGILSDSKRADIQKYREAGYYASGVHLPNSYYSVFGEQIELPGCTSFNSRFIALPSGWWFKK
jgi:dTDP-4-amino-4,6-dideoxygalactose transaminase